MPLKARPELLTLPAVARHLGVCTRTVARWLDDGSLPPAAKIVRGRKYFRRSDIEGWIGSRHE